MSKQTTAILVALLTALGSAAAALTEHMDPSEPQQEITYPLLKEAVATLAARSDDLEARLLAIEETLEGLPGSPVIDSEGGDNEDTIEAEAEELRAPRKEVPHLRELPTTDQVRAMR